MKVMIAGAGGQLGTALQTELQRHTLFPLRHSNLDITDRARVVETARALRPDIIVNASAYNQVDKAETDRDAAFAVNEAGPRHLAAAAAELGIPVLHVSTDYVFDGAQTRPYVETDPTHPLSVYAQSKLAGEEAVRAANPKHYIVRTAWLYHDTGRNFFRLMLALSEKGPVKVVSDQISSPTYAPHLAAALARLIETGAWGLYHMAGAGEGVSRYEQLKTFYDLIGHRATMTPVPASSFPQPAARPRYSALATGRTPRIVLPDWREGVAVFAHAFLKAGRA
jgi:dTDP-4-dehydrorhamnose reductase